MTKTTKLTILSLLGFLCTIKLAFIYYQSNYNPYATPSFCSINGFVDCDGVAATSKSVFLGVPLSYWGMFFYIFVLTLLYSDTLSKIKGLTLLKVFKSPFAYISILGLTSVIISVWLAITSFFLIHKLCILCFVTYIINFFITLISTDFKSGGFKSAFQVSCKDFIDGVRDYTIPFVIAIILASVFLSYTTFEMPFASRKQSIKHYMLMKTNPYKISGNILGNKGGKFKVDVYTDYVCPHCFMYNIMLHKVVRENKEVFVQHHNFPLDKECNPYIDEQMHKGACRMARYAIAAENQGKYWDMASALFETHPKTDGEAIKLAQGLGIDIARFRSDILSPKTSKRLSDEIDEAISKNIDGTPTLVIGSRHYTGLKPYYEFKRIIKEGAR